MVNDMASTADLCKIITTLGGNPEALSDKRTKTLSDEIIRILSCGSCLHLNANQISYDETTVGAKLNSLCSTVGSLRTKVIALEERVPTSAEVVSAINSMTDEQVSTVKTKLGIQ